ncbi:hypothetical protein PQ469_00480 [Mucilaginibacter sp. KACC 22773]|uniref:hypothetical protein n=1 Tax=Mucilaginibacter sp. KACC 22773 TaxID=3025671 RepID=UPI0023657E10|nr:hypothetical protein [Mucilaginibacter sp. KACC 22773]WDF78480.1 hypothetical protein PQ469_00480 [Mucilaginibacter sp. KACC 22773]
MNICRSQAHWEKLIYGLIYPGFVGSMIYELIPQSADQVKSLALYFTLPMVIKILITLFYTVDYLHLYGDLEDLSKDKVARDWIYVLCDFLSALFFFLAFVMVKLQHFGFACLLIGMIPLIFVSYKRRNCNDLKFQIPYAIFSIGYVICYLIKFGGWWFGGSDWSLFWIVSFSLIIDVIYVIFYYDRFSKDEDNKIYMEKKE